MERFDLRLDPVKVVALKRLAGRLSFETGASVRWTELVRAGIDVVLANNTARYGAINETEQK